MWFFVKFWGAKVSMHSWRGHALKTVRVLFLGIINNPVVKLQRNCGLAITTDCVNNLSQIHFQPSVYRVNWQ